MELGIIGLGKMGLNLALNMTRQGHKVVGTDINSDSRKQATKENIPTVDTLSDLLMTLPERKIVWIMVPNGDPLQAVLDQVINQLNPNDIVIDGGNSNYKTSQAHGKRFADKGIHFFDVGTSGGTSGANNGACLMIGGNKEIFSEIEPLFQGISVENGYMYAGEVGSGHFLKMVHNGIEYGMMQAIAEGFDVLEGGPFDYNLEEVAKVWNNGSVIRSWLMELAEDAFKEDAKLDNIKGIMNSSGEGKWTVETALDYQVPTPVIALSLMMRYRSLYDDTFTGKVVAALRNGFGGHDVEKK
ncbi:phosphogluconate dehydrogenase (NAD(+)-dependent, decarboxylating) [Vagococcus intermedius]|uniref:Decarboxylating 6-phosphogluconate dehydrogenase n=1 Tax=Vagococcus intermedius TaxID=2991418 RepID=A0AAF0CU87_9ENTE|nr:decarboxylating 6-phosphogluconate dehydrogenase [Vagococcus intermedius]WEG72832.1 decarboxylating 6-phosphogluconate dehydrogenase [Vagococcus intermedius]WEG74918.1 decarboxylating 6-phosphogluconate dehydrogenase [Vagococcus intermedius]